MSAWILMAVLVASTPWRGDALRVAEDQVEDFAKLEEIASQYLGRTYAMGGVGEPDFDCSGFVCRVYAEAGYALPRVSREQAQVGDSVDLDRIGPGDLLFFASGDRIDHVALYLGDGQMIHAASGAGEVMIAPLSSMRASLVAARRVLGLDLVDREPVELQEHPEGLPLTLRRSSSRLRLSSGPELGVLDRRSSIRARMGATTEGGDLAPTLVPEVLMHWPSIALRVELAAVIRAEETRARLQPIERVSDVLQFIRTTSLGLPGADLEIRFSRLSDYSLGSGDLLDRLTPASSSSGLPGLSFEASPLSFLFAHRGLGVEAFLDDVVDPGLMGLGYRHHDGATSIGALLVTDQRGRWGEDLRAITSGEVSLEQQIHKSKALGVGARFGVQGTRALQAWGYGGSGGVDATWRSRRVQAGAEARIRAITGPLRGSQFGPTYVAHRGDELEVAGARFLTGGSLSLDLPWLAVQASYEAPVVGRGTEKDELLTAFLELRHVGLPRARGLDLRIAYSARAPWSDNRLDVLHGLARLAVSDGWAIEGWVEKGTDIEAGTTLSFWWSP